MGYRKVCMILIGLVVAASGCARIRTEVVDKPRVDQELQAGNRGYLMGKAPAAGEHPRTRQMFNTDIELATVKEMNPWASRKAVAPPPQKVTEQTTLAPAEMARPSESDLSEEQPVPKEMIESPQQEVHPSIYKVKSGDTLEKIAMKFYGDSSQWRRIFEANRDRLKAANKIYIGQKLVIPPRMEGTPKKHHRHAHSNSTLK